MAHPNNIQSIPGAIQHIQTRIPPLSILALTSIALMAVGLISGCGGPPPAQRSSAFDRYAAAVHHTAIFRPGDERPLRPITRAQVTVITFTSWDYAAHPSETLGAEVWVTVAPELKDLCQSWPRAGLDLRARQLLGLPPDGKPRRIAVLEVATADLFRPCPDPDPAQPTCAATFPEDVSADHVDWFARQALSSRRVPGGYPWTGLGYTWDWAPDAQGYGASEYVVRKGAPYRLKRFVDLADYCAP